MTSENLKQFLKGLRELMVLHKVHFELDVSCGWSDINFDLDIVEDDRNDLVTILTYPQAEITIKDLEGLINIKENDYTN